MCIQKKHLMKKLTCYCFIALLSGCTSVKFEQAQPLSSAPEKKIPASLHGNWVGMDKDTLIVEATTFTYRKEKHLLKEGEVEFRLYDEMIFLNVYDKAYWEVFIIDPSQEDKLGISFIYMEDKEDKEVIEKLKLITEVTEKEKDGEKYLIIDPSKKEFEEILKQGLFEINYEFRRIQ